MRVITDDIEDHDLVIFDFTRTSALDDSAVKVLEPLFNRAQENNTRSINAGLLLTSEDRQVGTLEEVEAPVPVHIG